VNNKLASAGRAVRAMDAGSPPAQAVHHVACRSSKPPASTSPTSEKNTATASYASSAKAARPSSCHFRRPSAEPSTTQSVIEPSAQSCSTPAAHDMDRHAASRRLRALAQTTGMRMPPIHPPSSATPTSPPCSTPASTSATSRSPPASRPRHHHALRPSPQPARPPPQLHPRRLHGVRHLIAPLDHARTSVRRPPLPMCVHPAAARTLPARHRDRYCRNSQRCFMAGRGAPSSATALRFCPTTRPCALPHRAGGRVASGWRAGRPPCWVAGSSLAAPTTCQARRVWVRWGRAGRRAG
jgi:hypothetical protein